MCVCVCVCVYMHLNMYVCMKEVRVSEPNANKVMFNTHCLEKDWLPAH